MLLRRITQHVKAQNWTAVALDFFIVVVGVFMGIQLGNWNESRADRDLERSALERLVVEYNQNLSLLSEDKNKSQRTLDATAQLLSMISPAPDPDISDERVAQILLDCMTNAKFIPSLGTTNSLMTSGDLRVIDDPDIQRILSAWQATAQVMIEWQEIERNHGEELILGLTYDYLAWPTIDGFLGGSAKSSKLESDFDGLFSSKRFEGMLHNRWYNTRSSIGRIENLETETHELITQLENRLAQL